MTSLMLDLQLMKGHQFVRWWPGADRSKFIADDSDEINWLIIMQLVVSVFIIESH